jgi:hypothetical protein
MTREYQPCGMCNRFPPPVSSTEATTERKGHCSGWDKPVLSTDVAQPCVLFLERGTWETRRAEQAISRDQFPRDRKAPAPSQFARKRTTAAT